jgi:hypothetical protein
MRLAGDSRKLERTRLFGLLASATTIAVVSAAQIVDRFILPVRPERLRRRKAEFKMNARRSIAPEASTQPPSLPSSAWTQGGESPP